MKPKLEKSVIRPPNPAIIAQRAADLVNQLDDRDALRVFWDHLDEPVRESMLAWFAEWDREFCESLNPQP